MAFYVVLGLSSFFVALLFVALKRTARGWGRSGETLASKPFPSRAAKAARKAGAGHSGIQAARKATDWDFNDWGLTRASRPGRRLAMPAPGEIRKPWGW